MSCVSNQLSIIILLQKGFGFLVNNKIRYKTKNYTGVKSEYDFTNWMKQHLTIIIIIIIIKKIIMHFIFTLLSRVQ